MLNKQICKTCRYSEDVVYYIDWFYCNKPNGKEFKILGSHTDPPEWCPNKGAHK